MSESPDTQNNKSSRRSRGLLIVAMCFILIGAGYGVYWWIHGRHHESLERW